MSKFPQISRRRFLHMSALSTSSVALASCSTLDNYFMGDVSNLKEEVVILGGGIAGLVAAFELKKKKIPFRIFEASSRLGGRVQTVRMDGESPIYAEMGAEYFSSTHKNIFALLKELNLEGLEIRAPRGFELHHFYLANRNLKPEDLVSGLRRLTVQLQKIRSDIFSDQDVILTADNLRQFPLAEKYDKLSIADLFKTWQGTVDANILKVLEIQVEDQFGAPTNELSALQFLMTLDSEGSSLLNSQRTYKVKGGFSELVQALSERVSGVIPDFSIKMNRSLREVREKLGVFELVFNTPQGVETYRTQSVICTIPFSKLKEVKGISLLDISAEKKNLIASQSYGRHFKGALAFATPFWKVASAKHGASVGNITGDLNFQKIWDSLRGLDFKQGVLSFQTLSRYNLKNPQEIERSLSQDLNKVYDESGVILKNSLQFVDWSQRKWSLGSKALIKPGEFFKTRGVAAKPEYEGRFIFAGEHVSLLNGGTVEGAIETALLAVNTIKI